MFSHSPDVKSLSHRRPNTSYGRLSLPPTTADAVPPSLGGPPGSIDWPETPPTCAELRLEHNLRATHARVIIRQTYKPKETSSRSTDRSPYSNVSRAVTISPLHWPVNGVFCDSRLRRLCGRMGEQSCGLRNVFVFSCLHNSRCRPCRRLRCARKKFFFRVVRFSGVRYSISMRMRTRK